MMSETAAAKINLFLHVGPVKPNGRHDLDSLVVFARGMDVCDTVEVEAAETLTLSVKGATEETLGPSEENLVISAAKALQEAANVSHGAHIHLTKRLPVAAGIGGGSADAAATLRALCRLWDIDSSFAQDVAPGLGGDVPVALANVPAFMRGEGERVKPINLQTALPAVLVNPNVACPTGAVFQALDSAGERARVSDVESPPIEGVDDGLRVLVNWLSVQENHLEAPALELCPIIDEVLGALYALDTVLLSRMSGSGATCFGLFETMDDAREAADVLRLGFPEWWVAACELGAG